MKGILLTLALSICSVSSAQFFDAVGQCTTEPNTRIGKTVCNFPVCPAGNDCSAPTIDRETAAISFSEPRIQMQGTCSSSFITGPCWQVEMDFNFALKASDPSGVAEVGPKLLLETSGRRETKYISLRTNRANNPDRYDLTGGLITHVRVGARMEISVVELCAKDTNGNEGCIPATLTPVVHIPR